MTDREMVEAWIGQLLAESYKRFEREYSNVRMASQMLAAMDERDAEPVRWVAVEAKGRA